MSDGFIHLPDDTENTGQKIRVNTRTVDTNTVCEYFHIIQDLATDVQAEVMTLSPIGTEGGLIVRNIPSGTQVVSGTVSVIAGGTQTVAGTVTSVPSGTQIVAGSMSVGGFVSSAGPPLLIAGSDGTMVRLVAVDSSGFLQVNGSSNTQPVSGTVTTIASGVNTVAGTVTTVPSGTQTITGTVSVSSTDDAASATPKAVTDQLITSGTTTDQQIVAYTVTSGKTFYLEMFSSQVLTTTYSATPTYFGPCSLESPVGTKIYTKENANMGTLDPGIVQLTQPLAFAAGAVVRWVCTPSGSLSFTWRANIMGYEK